MMNPGLISAFCWLLNTQTSPLTMDAHDKSKGDVRVIATIGGKAIYQHDLQNFRAQLWTDEQRAIDHPLSPEAEQQLRMKYLQFRVLEEKAKKEGLEADPKIVSRLALAKSRLLVDTLINRHDGEFQAESVLDDEKLKAYFEQHKASFMHSGTFTARHILIQIHDAGDLNRTARSESEAITKAQEALKALEIGTSWNEVAKKFSDDSGSRDSGGLYENINFGSFVREFDEAVKSQPIGKPGKLVRSQYGYHIIQVEKIVPGGIPEFETVKASVKRRAEVEKREEAFRAFCEKAQREFDLEVIP
jgi:parvulin-like peptidyl-prolyl isomerase